MYGGVYCPPFWCIHKKIHLYWVLICISDCGSTKKQTRDESIWEAGIFSVLCIVLYCEGTWQETTCTHLSSSFRDSIYLFVQESALDGAAKQLESIAVSGWNRVIQGCRRQICLFLSLSKSFTTWLRLHQSEWIWGGGGEHYFCTRQSMFVVIMVEMVTVDERWSLYSTPINSGTNLPLTEYSYR